MDKTLCQRRAFARDSLIARMFFFQWSLTMWIELIRGKWCVCDAAGVIIRCDSRQEALDFLG